MELREMGASEADIERYLAQRKAAAGAAEPDETAEIWPDMVPVVDLFEAMRTQWRRTVSVGPGAAVIVYEGLRYEALPTVVAMLGLETSPELLRDLQTMEQAALAALNRA